MVLTFEMLIVYIEAEKKTEEPRSSTKKCLVRRMLEVC